MVSYSYNLFEKQVDTFRAKFMGVTNAEKTEYNPSLRKICRSLLGVGLKERNIRQASRGKSMDCHGCTRVG